MRATGATGTQPVRVARHVRSGRVVRRYRRSLPRRYRFRVTTAERLAEERELLLRSRAELLPSRESYPDVRARARVPGSVRDLAERRPKRPHGGQVTTGRGHHYARGDYAGPVELDDEGRPVKDGEQAQRDRAELPVSVVPDEDFGEARFREGSLPDDSEDPERDTLARNVPGQKPFEADRRGLFADMRIRLRRVPGGGKAWVYVGGPDPATERRAVYRSEFREVKDPRTGTVLRVVRTGPPVVSFDEFPKARRRRRAGP